MTNTADLEEGEELIMEVHDKVTPKQQPKRTWRHAFKEAEATKAKDQKTGKSPNKVGGQPLPA